MRHLARGDSSWHHFVVYNWSHMHFGYAQSVVNLQVKFLDQEFLKQHRMFLESLFLLVHFVLFKTCLESWLVYAKYNGPMKLVINTLLICTTYLPMEPNLHGLRCLLIPSHLHSSKRDSYHVQLGHLSIKILV